VQPSQRIVELTRALGGLLRVGRLGVLHQKDIAGVLAVDTGLAHGGDELAVDVPPAQQALGCGDDLSLAELLAGVADDALGFLDEPYRGGPPMKARDLEDVVHRVAEEAPQGGDVDVVPTADLELIEAQELPGLGLLLHVRGEEFVDVGANGERTAVSLVREGHRPPALARQPTEVAHGQVRGKVALQLPETLPHRAALPAAEHLEVWPDVPW